MRLSFKPILISTVFAVGVAQASTVTYQTNTSFGPNQASAAAYRTVVTTALAQAGTRTASVPLYSNLTNQGSLAGVFNNNLASKVTVDFLVPAALAGSWSLRFGGDYGYGAAVFLDGVALGFNSSSMFFNNSYADPTQSFLFNAVNITAGVHKIEVYGLEDCCDSGAQGQFRTSAAAVFTTFGTNDGLLPVPEASSAALLSGGLLALAMMVTRRRRS